VSQLNTVLGQIGTISDQIVALKGQGGSVADLENQRNALCTTVSGLVQAQFAEQPDGDMIVFTPSGVQLPTHSPDPLSLAAATTGPSLYYPGGGLPGIELGGSDITGQLGGGSIGANLALRDTTMPTYGAELDEFSQNLAGNFSAQGLNLFTDGQGNVPAAGVAGGGTPVQSGYLGFSATITVNPYVVSNPVAVVNGTQAVAGSPTGASSFTPNPNNLAGFTGMISRVLDYALGPDVQQGVAQPPANTSSLGASGTLAAPFNPPATLGDFANDITASQSTDAAEATTQASDGTATQQSFAGQLQSSVGVNMDSQMSLMIQLQNAYGANAKIISTIQSMESTLLAAV
jgi:flagellar hook-associated protein 1 FlgK